MEFLMIKVQLPAVEGSIPARKTYLKINIDQLFGDVFPSGSRTFYQRKSLASKITPLQNKIKWTSCIIYFCGLHCVLKSVVWKYNRLLTLCISIAVVIN